MGYWPSGWHARCGPETAAVSWRVCAMRAALDFWDPGVVQSVRRSAEGASGPIPPICKAAGTSSCRWSCSQPFGFVRSLLNLVLTFQQMNFDITQLLLSDGPQVPPKNASRPSSQVQLVVLATVPLLSILHARPPMPTRAMREATNLRRHQPNFCVPLTLRPRQLQLSGKPASPN